MDAPADAFGPIDRPDQVALTAVDPEAIDPTAILSSQQGAGSSADFAHGSPGPDIFGSGLYPARNCSLGGATQDRNSRRRTRSLRAVIDPTHINVPTFAREATR
jgi:hypothetical protein